MRDDRKPAETFRVAFYLEPQEFLVKARNKTEAIKKAKARLSRKKPNRMVNNRQTEADAL